ncbi:MAG: hypothetical protein LBQ36_07875, partial [Synergistaceae bacterium]|nr:hypothetical protein [Synergistaceae bacterium]
MNEELIEWLDLGEISYDEALEIQTRLHGECWRGAGGDKAIFQQNEPLITCGLDSDPAHVLWSEEHLRGAGIKIRRVKRGGGVSYHGPGQMVASLVCRFLRYADN